MVTEEGIERLAIIRDVGIGLRDLSVPVLWFTVSADENSSALQVFGWEEAGEIIKDAGVEDVRDLEGRACWVHLEINLCRFLRMAKI